MFLAEVRYEDFQNKIKLVGFTKSLRSEQMRLIASPLNFSYDEELICQKWTPVKSLLADEDYGFDAGMHSPQKLLLTGFLYCEYERADIHINMLWCQIKPNSKKEDDSVSISELEKLIYDLLYVAIDQRLKFLNDSRAPISNHLRHYLGQCMAAKYDFTSLVLNELQAGDTGKTQITHSNFMRVITEEFCRPASLR